ncbi:hypothetical protein ACWC3X_44285, partial [Streptomyces populi]
MTSHRALLVGPADLGVGGLLHLGDVGGDRRGIGSRLLLGALATRVCKGGRPRRCTDVANRRRPVQEQR